MSYSDYLVPLILSANMFSTFNLTSYDIYCVGRSTSANLQSSEKPKSSLINFSKVSIFVTLLRSLHS